MADRKVVRAVGASNPFPSSRSLPSLESIPVRRAPFPTEGKPANIGGLLGRAPFTPGPLIRDAIASEAVGRFVLPVAASLLAPDVAWKKLRVERPTIVMSLTVDSPGETLNGNFGPRIYYNYGKIPDTLVQAQRSTAMGTCFLSNPGDWWLRVEPPDLEDDFPDVDCLLVDASHPEVARWYLDQPGCNLCNETNVDLDAVSATLIPFGRYARAVTVQNVPPAAGGAGDVVRYVVGQNAISLNTGAWTGVGFRLLVNGSVTFSGKALNGFGIYACTEAAAGAVEVVRYLD